MGLSGAARQAEILRKDGNTYFNKDRFGAAIDAYTEAITLCPNVPVYWTNRALCHRKRNDWKRVEEDCRKALQLESNSVKAHYMLGLALLQREEYAEGVKELQRALDLGRGANPKSYMVEEIWQELAKAKYLEWEQASTMRSWELQNLKYVLGMIAKKYIEGSGFRVKLHELRFLFCHREVCETALKEKYFLDDSQMEDAATANSEQLLALERVFAKASEPDTPIDVPDYLCCKITLDIFRDPVITPSGLTYERAVILEHIQKVGSFDPITRTQLYEYQLVPNLAIKEAVQAFLEKHSWAYKLD